MENLLPASTEAPRCAPFTREMGIDPAGTAIRADQVFLVDLARPWPKAVRDHPRLAGIMDLVGGLPQPSRLLAAVPRRDTPMVTVFRRTGGEVRSTSRVRREDLAAQLQALAGADPARWPTCPPSVLICTQGSHDLCCGSDGERLAAQADRAGVEVYRISHTGGHRFAPTALTFPDGRMWAYLDPARLRSILDKSGDPAELAQHCRGWIGAERGFAQVAERAVFASEGWGFDRTERQCAVHRQDGGRAVVEIRAGRRRWQVEVAVAREVPTISCRSQGGLPAKTAYEYRVLSVIEGATAR